MKVYKRIDGLMHTADHPDGSMLLALNSTNSEDGARWDELPVEMVDYERKVYARMAPSGVLGKYGAEHPFPERWHEPDAYSWVPLANEAT